MGHGNCRVASLSATGLQGAVALSGLGGSFVGAGVSGIVGNGWQGMVQPLLSSGRVSVRSVAMNA